MARNGPSNRVIPILLENGSKDFSDFWHEVRGWCLKKIYGARIFPKTPVFPPRVETRPRGSIFLTSWITVGCFWFLAWSRGMMFEEKLRSRNFPKNSGFPAAGDAGSRGSIFLKFFKYGRVIYRRLQNFGRISKKIFSGDFCHFWPFLGPKKSKFFKK